MQHRHQRVKKSRVLLVYEFAQNFGRSGKERQRRLLMIWIMMML
jgi:hypothetical protein